MLDHAGDTPTAPPPESFLIAFQGGGKLRVTRVEDGRLPRHSVRRVIADEWDDDRGLYAAPDGAGGYHVGRSTLVRVDFGDAGTGPITWARFAADNAGMGKGELRVILADLIGRGEHHGGGGAHAAFTVRVVPAVPRPEVSPARLAAEAELARLDALVCRLAQARRRYVADTACNAWTLEQAAKDLARAAEAAAQAFAARSELA